MTEPDGTVVEDEPGSDTHPDDPSGSSAGGGRRLLRDNVSVATGTLLSRITGVARLIAVYAFASSLADAYLLANNTPNIIYELILGGILTATLVPLFTEHLDTRDREATDAVVSVILVALAALTAVAVVVAPLLMLLYGQNVDPDVDGDQFRRVGIILSLLFVPQIFFYGLMSVGSALLNARRRFFAAAWAPVLNNVVVVSVLLGAAATRDGALRLDQVDDDTALLLLIGLGTTAGIAAMALSLLPALWRAGVRLRFRPRFRHPAVRKAAGLSGWTLGYVVANQVAAQVVLILAVSDAGAVRSYQAAFIFFQLPHGLLAVSLMTTVQPGLAQAFVRRSWAAFHSQLLRGLRLLTFVMTPAAIGYLTLAVLAESIGARSRYADGPYIEVAIALGGFAPGLLGFSLYLFVLRAFYATQDTKRPFWLNLVENAINVVLAVGLGALWGLRGLTLAYSGAYLVAAALALVVLVRRLPPGFDLRAFVSTLARCLVAAAVMAAAVVATVTALTAADAERIDWSLVVAVPVGGIAYVATTLALGVVRDVGLAGPLDRLRRH